MLTKEPQNQSQDPVLEKSPVTPIAPASKEKSPEKSKPQIPSLVPPLGLDLRLDLKKRSLRLPGKNSIGTRLFLSVIGAALVGLGGLSLYLYQTLFTQAKHEIQDTLLDQAVEIQSTLDIVEQHAILLGTAATFLKEQKINNPKVYESLAFDYFLKMPEAAFAVGFGQTPRSLTPQLQWFFPYYYYDQGVPGQVGNRLAAPYSNVFYSELSSDTDSTAYYTQNYYTVPVETQKELWVEPYASYGSLIATYATPIVDEKTKELLGVTNIDINVEKLGEAIEKSSVVEGAGYFMLLSAQNRLLFYPPQPPTLPGEGELMPESSTIPDLNRLVPLLTSDQGLLADRQTDSFWAYQRVKGPGWLIVANVPQSVVLRPVLFSTVTGTLSSGILLAAVVFFFVRWLNQRLQPILDECNKLAQTDEGMIEKLENQDEIGRLSTSFFNLLEIQNKILDRQRSEAQQADLLGRIARLRQEEAVMPLISEVLADLRQTLGVDRISFHRISPSSTLPVTIVAESVGSEAPALLGQDLGNLTHTLMDLSHSGQVVALEDMFQAGFNETEIRELRRWQFRSSIFVQVMRGDEPFALLVIDRCQAPHRWTGEERQLVQQMASRLGQSLSNLGALEQRAVAEQERQRGEALQQELLQLLMDVEGAAQGDLTVRAEINDGPIGIVADFFNAIVENLRDIVMQVQQTALKVNDSMGNTDQSMRQLAKETLEQSQQLTQALETIGSVTQSIREVAANARKAAQASQSVATVAENSGVVMDRTVDSILQLRETVSETAKKVKRLGEASQQISKVVALINQIALKTNLLAVNASIEAARAGEEGQGFAVVAEEVGALAAQSAEATKEIEQVVEAIQRETSEVVSAMESGTSQVVLGTQLVENAKQNLERIVAASRQVNQLFSTIARATDSQVKAAQQVQLQMTNIAKAAEQSSTASRQASTSLQSTVSVTQKLQESMGNFKVNQQ